MIKAIPPAIPDKKVRRAAVKPVVVVGIQPRAVDIWGLVVELPGQLAVGSMAKASLGERKKSVLRRAYVRIGICLCPGKNFFI